MLCLIDSRAQEQACGQSQSLGMALAVTMILAGPRDTGPRNQQWGWGPRIGPDQERHSPPPTHPRPLIKANVTWPIPHTLSVSGPRILLCPPGNKSLVQPTQPALGFISLHPTKGFGFFCPVLSSPCEVGRVAAPYLLSCPKGNLKFQLALGETRRLSCAFSKVPR